MAATDAASDVDAIAERCWCCANEFDPDELVRLGSHPEVGVCANCARWLWRRARQSQDEAQPGAAAAARRLVFRTRERVISAGLHRWPLIGRTLRWIDRKLP